MLRIIFLLMLFLMNGMPSQAAIEIYSAGRRFSSFEEYQKMDQKSSVVSTKLNQPIPAENQSIKPAVSDPGQEALKKLSYENSIHHVMVNFDQNWENPKPKFMVGADQLEHVIQKAMENQHMPTLLVFDPKKMRILSYNVKETLSGKAQTSR